jgi:hypothetical protein
VEQVITKEGDARTERSRRTFHSQATLIGFDGGVVLLKPAREQDALDDRVLLSLYQSVNVVQILS